MVGEKCLAQQQSRGIVRGRGGSSEGSAIIRITKLEDRFIRKVQHALMALSGKRMAERDEEHSGAASLSEIGKTSKTGRRGEEKSPRMSSYKKYLYKISKINPHQAIFVHW